MNPKLFLALIVLLLAVTIYVGYQYFKKVKLELEKQARQRIDDKKLASDTKSVIQTVFGSTKSSSLDYDKVLSKGQTSEEVVVLQKMLFVSPTSGYFGDITQEAAKLKLGVDSVSLNSAINVLAQKKNTEAGGVATDMNGKMIKNKQEAWTQSPQIIYTLVPKGAIVEGKQLGYNDFTIGKEYSVGSNFDLGSIIDHTNSEVLTMKLGDVNYKTRYFYAQNKQIAVV
jgi:hypothetical protein